MAEIKLQKLRKEFDGRVVACDDLDLTFDEGSTSCLLGPSGCGKTTLMRMIAGLETPTSGGIMIGGQDVTNLRTRKRDLGMVFQYPVVYRGTTVRENIAIPLKREKLEAREKRARVDEMLELLGLGDQENDDVSNLDNASRQKVAVARAIVRRPPVVLFDEPITNVDIGAKLQLKRVLKELFTKLNQTVVYVTHDQTEAMTLADKIALMRDGSVEQYAPPRELYSDSSSVFAGRFLGNPGMNFLNNDDAPQLVGSLLRGNTNAEVKTVGFRPENVLVSGVKHPASIAGKVEHVAVVTGGQFLVKLRSGDKTIKAKLPWNERVDNLPTRDVWWSVEPHDVRTFDAEGHSIH